MTDTATAPALPAGVTFSDNYVSRQYAHTIAAEVNGPPVPGRPASVALYVRQAAGGAVHVWLLPVEAREIARRLIAAADAADALNA